MASRLCCAGAAVECTVDGVVDDGGVGVAAALAATGVVKACICECALIRNKRLLQTSGGASFADLHTSVCTNTHVGQTSTSRQTE